MAEPKMLAWAVSLNFGDNGPLIVDTIVAPSPEAAVAVIAVQAGRQIADHPLHGIAVAPISAEWLEFAIKATKGQMPAGGAQVLSIVPRTEGFGPNFPPAS